MTKMESISSFLSNEKIAVAGVSRNKHKFGNAIFRELGKRGFTMYPLNPNMDDYEGQKCYHSLDELPHEVEALVISTKNETSLRLLDEAKKKGIRHVWLQQGSVEKNEIPDPEAYGMNIITKQCILMHAGKVTGVHAFHRWISKSFGNFPS